MTTLTKKIAVVGAGIAGLSASWALSRRHRITLYERNDYLGGHSNTVDITVDGKNIPVDTGFIVFNPPNYPYLVNLFSQLQVATTATDMSFGVSMRGGSFEYAGSDINGLFAQRRNAFKPRFWQMISDIRRFYRAAPEYLKTAGERSIGTLLLENGYSEIFIEDHLMPMAAAIWSASRNDIEKYPAAAFIRFFANHGLLELGERPMWHTVSGGSREYVKRLVADTDFERVSRLGAAAVRRLPNGVEVRDSEGGTQHFDEVILACHGDEALQLLDSPSSLEEQILGAFRYSANEAVLHEDQKFMPRRRAAWSSWNYIENTVVDDASQRAARPLCVSYWMNKLQALETNRDIIVTLNPTAEPTPAQVHGRFHYTHPIFDAQTTIAQQRSIGIQGSNKIWFCGSYLGHGFHEDGIESGLWVAEQLGCPQNWHIDTPYPRLPQQYLNETRKAA
ncbi:MAG: NAD(P)/FAD-dependent oxidoreductase [Gammaproteobacteria bacterium]